jgi:hypothetical protein
MFKKTISYFYWPSAQIELLRIRFMEYIAINLDLHDPVLLLWRKELEI